MTRNLKFTKGTKASRQPKKRAPKPPAKGQPDISPSNEIPGFDPTHPRVMMAQNLAAAAIASGNDMTMEQVLRAVVIPAGARLAPFWLVLSDLVKLSMVAQAEANKAEAKVPPPK